MTTKVEVGVTQLQAKNFQVANKAAEVGRLKEGALQLSEDA